MLGCLKRCLSHDTDKIPVSCVLNIKEGNES